MGSQKKENVEPLVRDQNNANAIISSTAEDITNGAASNLSAPPDGGFKAYTVAIASFLTNGLIFGIINCYSVIYTVLMHELEHKDKNAGMKCALVGSLTIGTTFALSPVSGILTSFMGLRMTAVIGGSIAAAGLFLSSFVVETVEALWFTYGIMYGLGASLCYTPSLAILGHYFSKYLGVINGIVTVGSSAFTVFMPILMQWLINTYGLAVMFRVLCVFALGLILCGLLFTPVPVVIVAEEPKKSCFKALLKTFQCTAMWRIKKYRFWALSMPVALFGYFVPYVHIKKFLEEKQFQTDNLNLPLQCIAVTSALGRLLFGYLGDRKEIDRIFLQQVSFYTIGTLTIILPFATAFWVVVVIALCMGLFEGGFIALIGPIAFELVGCKYAAQGIGYMLGIAAVPLSVGPSIAGALHEIHDDYTLPFVLAGISPIVGATFMFLIRFSGGKTKPQSQSNGHVISLNQKDLENAKTPAPLLLNGHANQGKET